MRPVDLARVGRPWIGAGARAGGADRRVAHDGERHQAQGSASIRHVRGDGRPRGARQLPSLPLRLQPRVRRCLLSPAGRAAAVRRRILRTHNLQRLQAPVRADLTRVRPSSRGRQRGGVRAVRGGGDRDYFLPGPHWHAAFRRKPGLPLPPRRLPRWLVPRRPLLRPPPIITRRPFLRPPLHRLPNVMHIQRPRAVRSRRPLVLRSRRRSIVIRNQRPIVIRSERRTRRPRG
mmetsp:Transcript_66107/g.157757  ORF Transcript_66107/g.157757 Transcript_66107/m.157757 type:complete len:232 (+) Transcript_66107:490-1185(+)